MYGMILQGARSLGVEGMERLVADLKAAILSALAGGEPDACPRCGCARVVRRGRGAGGSQRWLCRGCGRSFSASTGRVLALSKLPAATWASYVEGMVTGESLARLAARCGACVKTGWFMRMRALEVMRSQLQPIRGGDGVSAQADELYLNESFSGRRSGMPREPHANGHGVRSRSISSLKVAVVTVVNDLGDMRSSYAAPLAEAGAASRNRYGAADAGEDGLGMVNAPRERLRGFLWRFRGVSTRRLQRYLWWFCWEERARRSDASREAMLRSRVANGSYESTRRDLEEEPQPFWDFWESRDESDVSNLV